MRTPIALLALAFSGCICGEPLIVDDVFVPPQEPAAPGDLHTYASNARVTFVVRATQPLLDVGDLEVAVDGALTTDDDKASERSDDVLTLHLRTQEAGEGRLIFTRGGEALSERTVTVVDADAMVVAITIPDQPGIDLPEVDPANVRIFAGGKAAFRTTLFKDGQEVFGLDAVAVTTSDPSVTSRNGIACASAGCDRQRNAVELTVPATTAANVDVTLTSGDASLALTVVPTSIDEVTNILADQRETTDLEDSDLTLVVARVLAGTEPVFGAPVTWAIDAEPVGRPVCEVDGDCDAGTCVDGVCAGATFLDAGDALQLEFSQNDLATVVATLGDRAASVDVESLGEGASVTSITAACGAGGAPLAIALLALARVRGRTGAMRPSRRRRAPA